MLVEEYGVRVRAASRSVLGPVTAHVQGMLLIPRAVSSRRTSLLHARNYFKLHEYSIPHMEQISNDRPITDLLFAFRTSESNLLNCILDLTRTRKNGLNFYTAISYVTRLFG